MTGIKLDPSVADPKVRAALEQIMKQSEAKFTELENEIKNLKTLIEKQRMDLLRRIEEVS
jgi:glutamate mutase epsilon subunit